MDEKAIYPHRINVLHDSDIFTFEGMNYDRMFYDIGVISTGEILVEYVYDLRNKRFDFGELGRFSFPHNTIREVRRVDKITCLEMRTGDDYSHLENFGMPWEDLFKVVKDYRKRGWLKEERLAA